MNDTTLGVVADIVKYLSEISYKALVVIPSEMIRCYTSRWVTLKGFSE